MSRDDPIRIIEFLCSFFITIFWIFICISESLTTIRATGITYNFIKHIYTIRLDYLRSASGGSQPPARHQTGPSMRRPHCRELNPVRGSGGNRTRVLGNFQSFVYQHSYLRITSYYVCMSFQAVMVRYYMTTLDEKAW